MSEKITVTKIAILETQMENIKEEITASAKRTDIKLDKIEKTLEKMCKSYVTQVEFKPIKNAVYFTISSIIMAVIGAGLSLIFIN